MPNLTVKQIIEKPGFWELSDQAQIEVLSATNSKFKALSDAGKTEVLYTLNPSTGLKGLPKEDAKEKTNWPREIARVGGGIVGGVGAMALPEPAKIFTVPAGVALGAAGGEAAYQLGQHAFGDPERPATSEEAAKKIGGAGLQEGALELAGGLVGRGAMKVLAPFAKKVTPEAKKAITYLEDKIQPVLTPAEATQSRALDIIENISDASLFGGGTLSDFRIKRQAVLDGLADDIINQFGKKVSASELGELFVRAIDDPETGRWALHKKAANVLYNNVEQLTEGTLTKVPVTKEIATNLLNADGSPMMKTVTKMVDKRVGQAVVETGSLKKFVEPLVDLGRDINNIESKNAGDDLMQAIYAIPDQVDFTVAKELRSRLLSRIDEFTVINKKAPAIGKAKKAVEILDREISIALKGHNQEAYNAWRAANTFYKEGKQQFNNTFVRRLLKMADDTGVGSESIGKAIFKPGAISNIRKARTALPAKDWNKMQSFYIQQLFTKSSSTTDGALQGVKLLNNMYGKPGSMGMETLKEILNKEQLGSLIDFAKTLKLTQEKQAEGLGRMWIQLTQAGAAGTFMKLGFEGEAASVLFGPAVLAKMMKNPVTVRWLTKGLKLPERSPEVVGITARLMAEARKIRYEQEKESP